MSNWNYRTLASMTLQDIERFWSKVQKSDGCWLWTGGLTPKGYGRFSLGNCTQFRTHRISYFLAYQQNPAELCILHHCDVRACVRPDHLFLGTIADNNHDMKEKKRYATGIKNGAHTHPERRSHVKGEQNGLSKLTEADVRMIRASSKSVPQLASDLSVSRETIGRARRGETWRHI